MHRAHDAVLADAVAHAFEGQSALVLVSGASSTGKTRACWEAVQPLAAENWLLWHPFDPTHAEAALSDLERVGPRTVVWLNEAQRYFGDERFGERIAAALHTLLTDPMRAPVLVLGTLWPEYTARYTAMPDPGSLDTFARTRELLAGRIVTVPDRFDAAALDEARRLADGATPSWQVPWRESQTDR
ncbi:ATP-binding protein [Streptomyces halobius]|uniref:ATP-binding protein n=1 Tax=Streptomyces halobius TaxID=2879846 RepID=A0ABY4MFP7_9ACTN|nr:ATP-binding protein [Streptomyces halobius]UQA96619.1 ATP-binding protein [Streptomyces halobius]